MRSSGNVGHGEPVPAERIETHEQRSGVPHEARPVEVVPWHNPKASPTSRVNEGKPMLRLPRWHERLRETTKETK